MMVHITAHAVTRAIERIPGCRTPSDARQALTCAAVELAASIGAPFVKLGTGQHVVVRDHAVITVLPKDKHVGTMSMERWQELQRGESKA